MGESKLNMFELEFVPFRKGMKLGQGYNSYLQEPLGFGAVTVTTPPTNANPAAPERQVEISSRQITAHEVLIQSKNISPGAAVYGWVTSANPSVDAAYLNRIEFEQTDLTYEVHAKVREQRARTYTTGNKYSFESNMTEDTYTATPHAHYGDRFIAGINSYLLGNLIHIPCEDLLTGADLFARFSIRITSRESTEDVNAQARLAFTSFDSSSSSSDGSDSGLRARAAIAYLQQNTQIIATVIERGGHDIDTSGNDTGDHNQYSIWKHRKIQNTDVTVLFKEVKYAIDVFAAATADHQGIPVLAVLGRYTDIDLNVNVVGLDHNRFEPYEYRAVERLSWQLCESFTLATYLEDWARAIPAVNFPRPHLRTQRINEAISLQNDIQKTIIQIANTPWNFDSTNFSAVTKDDDHDGGDIRTRARALYTDLLNDIQTTYTLFREPLYALNPHPRNPRDPDADPLIVGYTCTVKPQSSTITIDTTGTANTTFRAFSFQAPGTVRVSFGTTDEWGVFWGGQGVFVGGDVGVGLSGGGGGGGGGLGFREYVHFWAWERRERVPSIIVEGKDGDGDGPGAAELVLRTVPPTEPEPESETGGAGSGGGKKPRFQTVDITALELEFEAQKSSSSREDTAAKATPISPHKGRVELLPIFPIEPEHEHERSRLRPLEKEDPKAGPPVVESVKFPPDSNVWGNRNNGGDIDGKGEFRIYVTRATK
ncbi:hypothetical protein DFH27DRAFT_520591 [Peziza echinospora]|nr:hypothetical protein DFH27DRAFT_520591 [Peziza echinospora]